MKMLKRKRLNRKQPTAEERKHRTSRALVGAFITVSLGLIAFAVVVLLDPQTLPIKHIEVTGNFKNISPDKIRKIVQGKISGGFLAVDVAEINVAVIKLPWVQDVSVRRVWPDTLNIVPVEQIALAQWDKGGLVNAKGERFMAATESYPDGLPVFDGPDNSEHYMTGVYLASSRILSHEGQKVTNVMLDKRRALRLRLDNDIELVIGRANNMELLRQFSGIYNKALSEKSGTIDRVDLRYTNGFAVHWKVTHFPQNKIKGG